MKMLRDFLITEFPRENYEIVPVFSRQPININPEDCVFFEGSSNAAIQKSPFFIIQNARITNTGQIYEGMRLSSSFFGYWATEDFNLDISKLQAVCYSNKRLVIDLIKSLVAKKINIEDGVYIYAGNLQYRYYYHWITDTLSSLLAALEKIKVRPKLLLPCWYDDKSHQVKSANDLSFVMESLKHFDVDLEIFSPSDGTRHIKNLWILNYPSNYKMHNKNLVRNIRNYVFEKLCLSKDCNYPKKIFISRQQQQIRSIKNWSEVKNVLKQNNCEIIDFENLSWEEQVKYAFNADSIFGVHGGGLTNIIFMEEDKSVFEIHRANNGEKINDCFYRLASAPYVRIDVL